jgi:phage terminase small subunit
MTMSDLTPKQEAFALAYIETGNATEAYRRAYDCACMQPRTIEKRASELLAHREVAGRIAALKEQHAQRHAITIDKLTDMGLRVYQHAMADPKGSSAAVSAVMALAKMHGLIIEKRELSGKDTGPSDTTEWSVLERARHIAYLLAVGAAEMNKKEA